MSDQQGQYGQDQGQMGVLRGRWDGADRMIAAFRRRYTEAWHDREHDRGED